MYTNPTPGRFIDPLTDYGFKRLFGSEPHKDILIDFLNQLFQGRKVIRDLTYNNAERNGDYVADRKVIFDLLCTGDNGEQFIVEMQRARQENFKDRAVFYTSRLISSQVQRSKKSWNYQLKEVFFIALLEFRMESHDDFYLHNYVLSDRETHEIFYDKLEYKFIELPKFTKTEDQLETDLDRWLFLLKHLSGMDKIPLYLDKRVFEKVFRIAELSKLKPEERMAYDSSLKAKWDYESAVRYAEKIAAENAEKAMQRGWEKGHEMGHQQGHLEGIQEGHQQGHQEGIQEGIRQGLQQGHEKGIRETLIKNISSMLSNGIEEDMICRLLEVTPEFVSEVKKGSQ